jgi:hypothetical protein
MSFLRPLEGFIGVFHCLLAILVAGPVVFLTVGYGGAVRVGGKLVEFGGSFV